MRGRTRGDRYSLRRRVSLSLTGALALLVLVPSAAGAGAFGTLSYPVHGPVATPVNGARTVSAACPAGSHVLGGGQYVLAADRQAIVHSSAPFDGGDADAIPDDGWRSTVDSLFGGNDQVTEYAICSTKQPVYRFTTMTMAGPNEVQIHRNCPEGDAVLGGGVSISAGYSSAYVTTSDAADGAAWDAHAIAGLAGKVHQRVTDWAICAPVHASYRHATGFAPKNDFGEAAATCPGGTKVVGGGVRTPDLSFADEEDNVRATISSPFDGPDGNFVPDNGWQVEADNWNATYSFSVGATAICLS
jgi:hypothetical protein